MIITEQQYNSVVSGLRTQLELQRAHTAEKIRTINTLTIDQDHLGDKIRELETNCRYWIDQSESRLKVLKAAVDYAVTGKCEKPQVEPICSAILGALILAIDRRTTKKTKAAKAEKQIAAR